MEPGRANAHWILFRRKMQRTRIEKLMKAIFSSLAAIALAAASMFCTTNACAQIPGVSEIHGDTSRMLLGSGTGVTIGIVDSGVNAAHPALAGNDSQSNPRLVAQANFVSSEPGNTGQDAFGHGTSVASVALSSDSVFTGLAPDARYINARVLDSNNSFFGDTQVMNGIGFALSHGSDIVNLSLNFDSPSNNGNNRLDLMLDWAASTLGTNFTVSAGNINAHRDANGFVVLDENPPRPVRSPASAYNVVAVGRTGTPPGNPLGPISTPPNLIYNQVFITSASGPVDSPSGISNRDKPDVVAPGTAETVANANFQSQGDLWNTGLNGTSFSAPMVAGMMAQQIDYGRTHGLSTNPLVIKATLMNSADHVLEKNGNVWHPNASSVVGGVLQVTSPLDTDSGAGQINGLRLYDQYSAGQQAPGTVNLVGWDLHTIVGVSSLIYTINTPLTTGSLLDVTLDWFRHVTWTDTNGDSIANGADSFIQSEALDNLDLTLLVDGLPVAKSMSTIDNVEHLDFAIAQDGTYSIQVDRLDVPGSGSDELYGLAWNVAAVPEPTAIVLACIGIAAFGLRSIRRLTSTHRAAHAVPLDGENFRHVR